MINRDDYKSFLSVRPIDFVRRIEKQKQNNYTEFKTEDEYIAEKPTRDVETLGDDTKVYF